MSHSSQRGSALLWVIGSIIVLGLIGTAVSQFTTSANFGILANNRQAAGYYAALSGLNYAKTLDATAFEAILAGTGSQQTYTLADTTQFTLIVSAASAGAYPVKSIGTVNNGSSLEANAILTASITPVAPPPTTWGGGDYVISTGGDLSLPQSAKINGSVAGNSLTLSQYADVSGNVISDTSANLGQYANVGGYVCAAAGDVVLNQYAEVAKDVSANGKISVGQYAIAHQNAYATGSISMSQYAKIMLTGQAGGGINRAQYDFIGTPLTYTMPTVTCPETAAPIAPVITATGTANVPASSASSPIPPGQYKAWSTGQHGTAYLTSGTYTFPSIQYNQYMDLYLDASSGNPLTILASGAITTGQYTTVHIKTANTAGQYLTIAQIEATTAATKTKIHADAALIYMGSGTSMQWSQYGSWFGTLYAKTALSTGQYFYMVGALACPGSLSISSSMEIYEYVLADYAKNNWR